MNPELLEACKQPDGPLRPTYCNVPEWGEWFIYIAGFLAIAIFVYGMYRHRKAWFAGQPSAPARNTGHIRHRVSLFLKYVVGQRETLDRRLPAIFHTGIFWGFVLLFIGTVLATVDWDVWHLLLNRRFLTGGFYTWYEFVLDTAGFLFIVGLLIAMWRRYVVAPHYVLGAWDFVIWSLLLVNVTGFLVEGMRLAMSPVPWGTYSWVGQGLANTLFSGSETFVTETVPTLHFATWMIHAVAAVVFIAAIPFTNAVHMVTTATNAVLRSVEPVPPGATLQTLDLEETEVWGVSRMSEFNWKQRLGVDSCTRCGRCETVCPAFMSGTSLNPKSIIVDLSNRLRDELRGGATAAAADGEEGSSADEPDELIVGEGLLVEPPALWACTTCLACVETCPAFIEILDDIVDMRRYLTLVEGSVPSAAAPTLRNMGTAGNPWGYAAEDRLKWADGLDVPIAEPDEQYDVLYWVGCSASYDQRNQRIARSMVRLLRSAGVEFAVMAEERCHAESGRRMGDEYMYVTAAEENVANLSRYSFDRLVCHCPHCFNTLANEYPDYGADYDVVHHSQLLEELLADGRLAIKRSAQRAAFHDSCYLGRYNEVFEAPREVLRQAGIDVVELERTRENGLCCGGGGGRMWFEHEEQERAIEVIRIEEVLDSGVDSVAVACPFCLTMLESGVASKGADDLKVHDIAELLAAALDDGEVNPEDEEVTDE